MSYVAASRSDPASWPASEGSVLAVCAFGGSFLLGTITLTLVKAKAFGENSWTAMAVVCAFLMVTMALGAYHAVSKGKHSAVYDPMAYMCLSGAIYFGFGPLIYLFGDTESIQNLQIFYPATASDALFVTGINAAGLGLAGLCCLIGGFNVFVGTAAIAAKRTGSFPFSVAFYGSLLAGATAKYLIVLPYEFGLTEVVPSSLARTGARFLLVAILSGFAAKNEGNRVSSALSLGLVVAEVTIGLLMFNKTEMLLPIIAAGLGLYMQRFRLRSLLVYAGYAAAAYVFATPVVTYGRNVLTSLGGDEGQTFTIAVRAEIVLAYFSGSQMELASSASQSWWERLSYVPAQVAAVNFYNQGDGGTDGEKLLWLFVPRVLYPDKPIMSDAGVALNAKINGNWLSSAGVGIFVDGFYNWGYIGIVFYSATYGLMLRFFFETSRVIVRSRSVIMYPLVLMGVYAGIRTDGWWIIDVGGVWVLAVGLVLAFSFVPRP